MKAKKSLGQHFLTSEKALHQIVEAGDIQPADTILEIGPGKGVLTRELLARASTVIAIEKDRDLIPLLEETFTQEIKEGKLEIHEQDVLAFDPNTLGTPYKLIANIPYYITGAIIEQFTSNQHQPTRMVLLIQREVAERIVARDGKESILSIAVKAYGVPHIVARVPRGAFAPAPSVESAILAITDISRDFFKDVDEQAFFAVLKAVFGTKRKQISKSFGEFVGDKEAARLVLSEASIAPTARPEDLTLADWKKLAQLFTQNGVQ